MKTADMLLYKPTLLIAVFLPLASMHPNPAPKIPLSVTIGDAGGNIELSGSPLTAGLRERLGRSSFSRSDLWALSKVSVQYLYTNFNLNLGSPIPQAIVALNETTTQLVTSVTLSAIAVDEDVDFLGIVPPGNLPALLEHGAGVVAAVDSAVAGIRKIELPAGDALSSGVRFAADAFATGLEGIAKIFEAQLSAYGFVLVFTFVLELCKFLDGLAGAIEGLVRNLGAAFPGL